MKRLLQFVATIDRITIDSNFPLESTLNPNNALVGTTLNPLTLFNYEPLSSPQISEATITLKYDRTGFSVFLLEINIPAVATGNCIEVMAFGQVVVSETTAAGGFIRPKVLVVSNDMSQDTVVISIRGVLPPGAQTLGFAI